MSSPVVSGSGYSDVDRTGDGLKYVRRLDDMRASGFWSAIKARSFDLLELRSGDHVVDIGCGTGDDVRTLARLVAPGGRAVGLDASATMIAEARRRSSVADLRVDFQRAHAQTLPFEAATFDACRAERVLQHVDYPGQAVSEMVRVLRPGGRLALVEPDYGTLSIRGGDPRITAEILRVRREHFRSSRIGSELPLMLKALGVSVIVQVRTLASTTLTRAERALVGKFAHGGVAACAISADEAERWLHDLEAAGQAGGYYHGLAVFLVGGRKG